MRSHIPFRVVVVGLAWSAAGGCASTGPGAAAAAGPPPPVARQVNGPGGSGPGTLLLPLPLRDVRWRDAACREEVALGAILVSRPEGGTLRWGVALVLQIAGGAPSGPLLSGDRTVVLEVGDERVEGDLSGDGRFYHVGRRAGRRVETLVVPVGAGLLRRLATATSVRVVVGRSLRFALGPEHRAALRRLLRSAPVRPSPPPPGAIALAS